MAELTTTIPLDIANHFSATFPSTGFVQRLRTDSQIVLVFADSEEFGDIELFLEGDFSGGAQPQELTALEFVTSTGQSLRIDGFSVDPSVYFNRVDQVGFGAASTLLLDADDRLLGSDRADFMRGLTGADTLVGGGGNDTLVGDEGDDLINGGDGVDIAGFIGAFSDASFALTDANELLVTAQGTDTLRASVEIVSFDGDRRLAADVIQFQNTGDLNRIGDSNVPGRQRLNGSAEADRVIAGAGDDVLKARAGDDFVDGGFGGDIILAGDGNDTILAGAGDDTLKPGRGDDIMDGGDGDDILFAFRGDELLIGGAGNDTLLGNLGDDTMQGGAGDDRMQGGPGRDVFLYLTTDFGQDRIVRDFRVGSDTLDFSNIDGASLDDFTIRQIGTSTVIDVNDTDARIVIGNVDNLIGREDDVFVF